MQLNYMDVACVFVHIDGGEKKECLLTQNQSYMSSFSQTKNELSATDSEVGPVIVSGP